MWRKELLTGGWAWKTVAGRFLSTESTLSQQFFRLVSEQGLFLFGYATCYSTLGKLRLTFKKSISCRKPVDYLKNTLLEAWENVCQRSKILGAWEMKYATWLTGKVKEAIVRGKKGSFKKWKYSFKWGEPGSLENMAAQIQSRNYMASKRMVSSLPGTLKLLSEMHPGESQLENQWDYKDLKGIWRVVGAWEVEVSGCWWLKWEGFGWGPGEVIE